MYLVSLRKRKGWTQVELRRRSGIAQNSISRLETNPRTRPTMETVRALGKALRVDPLLLQWGPPPGKGGPDASAK